MLRTYLPYATPWQVYPQDVPGRWVAESVWPSPRLTNSMWYLNSGEQIVAPSRETRISAAMSPTRSWASTNCNGCPFHRRACRPSKVDDDANSVVFNSPPLESDMEILGYPLAKIRVASNVPVAKLAVRMTEVTPESKSWLVSYGLLNLTHRDLA